MPDPENPDTYIPNTYIECKRVKQYSQTIEPYRNFLRNGAILRFKVDRDTAMYLFETSGVLKSPWEFEKFKLIDYIEYSYPKDDDSRLVTMYRKVWAYSKVKAMEEDLDHVIAAFRVHGKWGVYCLTDLVGLAHTVKWMRKNHSSKQ